LEPDALKKSSEIRQIAKSKIFVAKRFQNSPDFWNLAINSPIWHRFYERAVLTFPRAHSISQAVGESAVIVSRDQEI